MLYFLMYNQHAFPTGAANQIVSAHYDTHDQDMACDKPNPIPSTNANGTLFHQDSVAHRSPRLQRWLRRILDPEYVAIYFWIFCIRVISFPIGCKHYCPRFSQVETLILIF